MAATRFRCWALSLPYGRRPLRIAAFCFPASASESHLFDPVPVARVATQQAHLPRGMEGTSCLPLRPHRDQPRRSPLPDVTLRSPATAVWQRFLVRAMAKVALHLDWTGRGLAARVVYNADHLAHAAAAAAIHWGTPVSDDRLRLRTAALAEHFSDGRHKRPASGSHVPTSGDRQPGAEGTARTIRDPGINPVQPCTGGEAKATRRCLERAAVVQSPGF